jgi:hypothetical protein
LKPNDGLAAAPRIYPEASIERGHAPHLSHLQPGFYCFTQADIKLVCYAASIGYTVFACALTSTLENKQYDLEFKQGFHKLFRPIGLVLGEASVGEDADVHSLFWEPNRFGLDRVTIQITGAEKVKRPLRPPKAKVTVDGGESEADGDVDAKLEHLLAKAEYLANQDCDCESLCTSEDTDSLEGVSSSSSGDSSEDEFEKAPKKPAGTHVVYNNGYFTFVDNPAFPDVKVVVVSRWCTEDNLGAVNKSKTVVPAHFGEDAGARTRAFWVLKAWMLWKASTNDFCNKRSSRRKLFSQEARDLRNAIVGVSSVAKPSTGSSVADKLVAQWAPDVLRPCLP